MHHFPGKALFLGLLAVFFVPACRQSHTEQSPTLPSNPQTTKADKALLDTAWVHSQSMNKDIPVLIVIPKSYNDRSVKIYPVVYLLHGAYGDYLDWSKQAPLKEYAEKHQFILVCPDGHEFGWYLDSPVDSQFRYETFMTRELVPWIDREYRIGKRGICGLSMGGHGAFYLGFRHQDIWKACGAISGGMDLRPFPNNWELPKRLGQQGSHLENWVKYSVVGQLDSLEGDKLAIYFDCGEEDFFFEVNEALHDSLEKRKIPHNYHTRPGAHNWEYFSASLPAHLDFFERNLRP